MPRPLLKDVQSHWYKPFQEFETSSLEFYSAVEAALERRKVPRISASRIVHQEEGMFIDKPEYLRVERKRLVFDVCAAPFGSSDPDPAPSTPPFSVRGTYLRLS